MWLATFAIMCATIAQDLHHVLCVHLFYVGMKICEVMDGTVNLMKHSMKKECILEKCICDVISRIAHSLDIVYDVL